jgi:hypothetical protein
MVCKSIAPLLLSLAGGPPDPPSPGGQAMEGIVGNIPSDTHFFVLLGPPLHLVVLHLLSP